MARLTPIEPKIDISLFFEVYDSGIFGGKGSIGYTTAQYCNCSIPRMLEVFSSPEKVEEYLRAQTLETAKFCNVPVNKVKLITEDEYIEKTEDDDYEDY